MEDDKLREALSQLGSAAGGLLNGVRLLLQAWQASDPALGIDVASQLASAASALGQVETILGTSFGISF
jgi:hypothetical protein